MFGDSTGRLTSTLGDYLLFILVGISWSVVGPSILAIIAQTDSTLNQYGLIFIAEPIGFIIGSLLGGRF